MRDELAHQLREAGFPYPPDIAEFIEQKFKEGFSVMPSLRELLMACGGKNLKLTADASGRWYAYSYINAVGTEGDTPEEAVAKLWLKLNKKI